MIWDLDFRQEHGFLLGLRYDRHLVEGVAFASRNFVEWLASVEIEFAIAVVPNPLLATGRIIATTVLGH